MKRRQALKGISTIAAVALMAESLDARMAKTNAQRDTSTRVRIHHSACRWSYNDIPLEDFCRKGKEMGLEAIDLLTLEEIPEAQKHGLTCSMVHLDLPGFLIKKGFNQPQNHKTLFEYYEDRIPKVAALGLKNFICFSGNRDNLSDEQGLANCVVGLQKLMKTGEKHGVTLCMELLNSKKDHRGYMCDRTDWGVALVKAVGSENFKLLYDIYHMQIMEGDVTKTITDNKDYIAHYHTAGVPGRNEIDETQELYYPAIMRGIPDTDYQGFVAQEFMPKQPEKLKSLENALRLCDV